MWKIAVAFIAFSLVALLLIMKAGDKVDMQGEAGHGVPTSSAPDSAPAPAAAPAPAPAPAATPAAATR